MPYQHNEPFRRQPHIEISSLSDPSSLLTTNRLSECSDAVFWLPLLPVKLGFEKGVSWVIISSNSVSLGNHQSLNPDTVGFVERR